MTQRKANPFVIRPPQLRQCSHVIGDYAAKELKLKRVATISDDFAFGHEQMSAFQRVRGCRRQGGQEAVAATGDAGLHALHRPDRQRRWRVPRVCRLQPSEIHARYADLGLKAKIPLLAGSVGMDDALLKSVGDEAVGVISASFYSAAFGSESNKRFVAAMQKTTACRPAAIRRGCISPVSAWSRLAEDRR
jgi:branched-chain amino acid transport system substrate-binding protein